MIAEITHSGMVFGLGVIWFGALFLALSIPRRGTYRPTRQHSGPGKWGRL